MNFIFTTDKPMRKEFLTAENHDLKIKSLSLMSFIVMTNNLLQVQRLIFMVLWFCDDKYDSTIENLKLDHPTFFIEKDMV